MTPWDVIREGMKKESVTLYARPKGDDGVVTP